MVVSDSRPLEVIPEMIRFSFFFFTMNFIHITNVLMFAVIVLLDITFTCTLTLFRYIYTYT